MTENYLSGKKRSLKLGILNYTEDKTTLEVIGNVGIGTTNPTAVVSIGNTAVLSAGIVTSYKVYGEEGNFTGVVTASSFSGDGSGLIGVAATDHVATYDLVVAGITTLHDDVRVTAGGIDVTSGIVSATQFDVGTGGIDVDGQTDLDEVVVAGVSTYSALVDVNNRLEVAGGASIDQAIVAGVSTFTGNITAATATFSGDVTVQGTLTSEDKTNIDSIGLVTARTGVRITNGGLVVTAGVTTFTQTNSLDDINVNTAVGTAITIHAGNIQSVGIITAAKFIGDGSGLANLPGINTEASSVFTDIIVSGGANITGVVTAGSYRGDGTNLTGIGTQGPNVQAFGLSVQGISTFHDDVRITGGGINAVGVITATSFSGSGANLTGIGTQGPNVQAQSLTVAGISTFHDDVRILAGGIDVTGVSTFAGNVNVSSLYVGDANAQLYRSSNDLRIDVAGNHDAYVRTNSGGGTGGNIYLQAKPSENSIVANSDGSVQIYHDNAEKFATTAVGATVYGNSKATTLHIAGVSTLTGDVTFAGSVNQINVTGVSTFAKAIDLNAGIDVDGQADLDEVVVAGVATFSSAVDISTGGLDVDGETQLDELVVAGVSTFSKNIDLNAGIDVDGQADLDEVVVAGVATFSGAIDANSTLDVDGDTQLDDLNVAGVATFSKAIDLNAGIDVDGQADLDEVVVAGVSTFSAKAVFNTAYPSIDADNEIQVGTAIQLGKAGVITATSFSGSGANLTGIAATDHVSTFDLVVAGISTFHDDVRITGGGLNAVGVITATSFSGSGANLTGIAATAHVSTFDLQVAGVSTFYNDVKIVGGGSTAGNQITIGATTLNDGTLTFDGTAGQLFSISNNLTDGSIFSVNDVSGMPSIDVGAAGTIQLAPYGAGELVGIGTTRPTSKLDVVGDVQVVGVVTATSFSGDGSSLTGVTLTDGSFIGLNVTGITTLGDDVTITAGGINVTGVSTFNDNVHLLDSDKLLLGGSAGTHDGLEVYHNGSHSFVNDTGTGNFYIGGSHIWIGNTNQTKPSIQVNPTTNTILYYNGSQKFETTITGAGLAGILTATGINLLAGSGTQLGATGILTAVQVDVSTGGLDVDGQTDLDELVVAGVTTFNGQTKFKAHATWDDSDEAKFGDSGDLRIYHTTSGSYIQEDSGSGHLNIGGSQVLIRDANIAGHYASFAEPTSGISGILTATGINLVAGSGRQLGATGILTAVQVDVSTGGLDVDGLTDLDEVVVAGAATFTSSLKVDGAVDIGTGGLDVDGQTDLDELRVAGVTTFLQGDLYFPDDTYFRSEQDFQIKIGDSQEFRISHNNTSQPLIVCNASGDTALYHGANGFGSKKVFETTGSYNVGFGATIYGNLHVTSGGSSFEATNGAGIITCSDFNARGANITGVVTASSFSGDGSALTGIEAGGTGEFYVGFTSSVTMNAASYETTGHTFPSTVNKTYTIDSIMAANVSTVGVGTTVNLIASISSNSGVAAGTTEQAYIAYNIPIAAGGAIELIKEPIVANPNDIVKLWATNDSYVGIASAIQVHMTYTQQDSTDFFGKYAANTSIASTSITGIHTAGPTYAAALQSIHVTNRSDAGAFPVDIMLTDSTGIVTTYLVKNLVIPKYSSVEILERPKRMETGSSLGVKVQQTGTIDVVVSGKKYS